MKTHSGSRLLRVAHRCSCLAVAVACVCHSGKRAQEDRGADAATEKNREEKLRGQREKERDN